MTFMEVTRAENNSYQGTNYMSIVDDMKTGPVGFDGSNEGITALQIKQAKRRKILIQVLICSSGFSLPYLLKNLAVACHQLHICQQ
jgi:hypothetical protein